MKFFITSATKRYTGIVVEGSIESIIDDLRKGRRSTKNLVSKDSDFWNRNPTAFIIEYDAGEWQDEKSGKKSSYDCIITIYDDLVE